MTDLVVGCPVQDRAWILPTWFEHVEAATAHVKPHYVFVGDPSADPATFAEIDRQCLTLGRNRDVVEVDEDFRPDRRVWNSERYGHMAALRNALLRHVRKLEPDVFWSLDSDILVAKETYASALQLLDGITYKAVGTKLYMTPTGSWCPSYGTLPPQGGLRRSDSSGTFKVDAIMASKLMLAEAYAVDYVPHRQGEDIGWSIAARAAGCKLGWDGRFTSKHVMSPEDLDVIDQRCGF